MIVVMRRALALALLACAAVLQPALAAADQAPAANPPAPSGVAVDADGNPIFVGNIRLVVPPGLAVVARNIMNATQIWAASGGGVGTAGDQLHSTNWMAGQIDEATAKRGPGDLAALLSSGETWTIS